MKQASLVLFIAILFLINKPAFSQFKISGEIRPRAEYNHGYKSLAKSSQDPTFFISQRTRLTFDYKTEKIKTGISLQDVRNWGSQSQLNESDSLSSIHEAWAELSFVKSLSLKVGRQEIIYDDHRMFGNVGWTQQARSHDIAIFKYENKKILKADLGIAYNQNQKPGVEYKVIKNYKALQYLWLHKDIKNLGISLLFLNNGNQLAKVIDSLTTDYSIIYSQTAGGRIEYKIKNLSSNGTFYYQTGKDNNNLDLGAYMAGVEVGYGFLENNLKFSAGLELLSGTNQSDQEDSTFNENNSFTPFYGTNHKFNGHMDYFYLGNHTGSVGLQDIYFKLKYTKEKFNTGVDIHLFSSLGDILDPKDRTKTISKRLGTEIDFTIGYKIANEVSVKFGYSQMFATTSMEALKGGSAGESNNWAWLMLVFKPNFFISK